MSDLVERIKAAKEHRCPHPFPRAPGMRVTPTYTIREDEIDELISALSTAREAGRLEGLEEAAKVAEARDLSIMSMTMADAEARKIAAAIRALKEKQP